MGLIRELMRLWSEFRAERRGEWIVVGAELENARSDPLTVMLEPYGDERTIPAHGMLSVSWQGPIPGRVLLVQDGRRLTVEGWHEAYGEWMEAAPLKNARARVRLMVEGAGLLTEDGTAVVQEGRFAVIELAGHAAERLRLRRTERGDWVLLAPEQTPAAPPPRDARPRD